MREETKKQTSTHRMLKRNYCYRYIWSANNAEMKIKSSETVDALPSSTPSWVQQKGNNKHSTKLLNSLHLHTQTHTRTSFSCMHTHTHTYREWDREWAKIYECHFPRN